MKVCPTCAAEVAQLLSVSDDLALLAIERDPPPGLRTRLMNVVEFERSQWLASQQAAAPATAVAESVNWWRRLPRLAYGAGAAVLVAAILLVVVLVNRNNVTVHTYQGGTVAQVVKGINLQGAMGTVSVRSDGTTEVSFTHLPALPSNLAYELWFIPAKGNPVPVGGFGAGADHTYSKRYSSSAAPYAVAAVTIEKAPGNWPAPSPNSAAIVIKLKS